MSSSKHIVILGSTGSIGTQTLEVVKSNEDEFVIDTLTAHSNVTLLAEQAKKYRAKNVVTTNEEKYEELKSQLSGTDIHVHSGIEAIVKLVQQDQISTVLTAMVGYSGLLPTISAVKAGKRIALANKETLVVAGELIISLCKEHGAEILPVDSEHSAIYQCLVGEDLESIDKLILTASGGPFKGKNPDFLEQVTLEQALDHPNWDMGAKITIDSATLMNKGLEVIEAKWLFGVAPDQIEVVVHPQSIIHSFVKFKDGSLKAQLGMPDMKLPIHYALNYPKRTTASFTEWDIAQGGDLTFEKPDMKTFRALGLAFDALKEGGNMPCILNAANEIAVEAFLNKRISFIQIPNVIEQSMAKVKYIATPTLDDYIQTNNETRALAKEEIS